MAAVIQKYQFKHKLSCLVANNTTSNNKLYKHLSKSLFIPKREQLQYISHILNLTIKALIYGKGVSKLKHLLISVSDEAKFNLMRQKGAIGKVYNIIKYII